MASIKCLYHEVYIHFVQIASAETGTISQNLFMQRSYLQFVHGSDTFQCRTKNEKKLSAEN